MGVHLHDDWREHVIEWVRVSDTRKTTGTTVPTLGYNQAQAIFDRIEDGEAMTTLAREYGVGVSAIAQARNERRKD